MRNSFGAFSLASARASASPTKPPPAMRTSQLSEARRWLSYLSATSIPSFRRQERFPTPQNIAKDTPSHEPRPRPTPRHPRSRDAGAESVPRLEPASRLAARVRRPGDRAGAGRRLSHHRKTAPRIRWMPISSAPAIRRCRSSTRSTASATAAASRRGAWSRSSTGRRSSPWRRRL